MKPQFIAVIDTTTNQVNLEVWNFISTAHRYTRLPDIKKENMFIAISRLLEHGYIFWDVGLLSLPTKKEIGSYLHKSQTPFQKLGGSK